MILGMKKYSWTDNVLHLPISRDIWRTTARFNVIAHITKYKSHDSTRPLMPLPIAQSHQTLRTHCTHCYTPLKIYLLGWSIQVQTIVTYNSLEALRTLQSHQASHWSHHINNIMYIGVIISISGQLSPQPQINPIVTIILKPFCIRSLWFSHSSWLSSSYFTSPRTPHPLGDLVGVVNLLASSYTISLRTSVHFDKYYWFDLFENLYLPQAYQLAHMSTSN